MHSLRTFLLPKDHGLDLDGVPHVVGGQGIVLMPVTSESMRRFRLDLVSDEDITELMVRNMRTERVGWMESDYHGGFGDQHAKYWVHGKKENVRSRSNPVNEVLSNLGVVPSSKSDEWDTVGIGRYREENDIIEEWQLENGQKTVSRTYITYLLTEIPDKVRVNMEWEVRFYEDGGYFGYRNTGINSEYFHVKVDFEDGRSVETISHMDVKTFNLKKGKYLEAGGQRLSVGVVEDGDNYRFLEVQAFEEAGDEQLKEHGTRLCLLEAQTDGPQGSLVYMHDEVKSYVVGPLQEFHYSTLTKRPYRKVLKKAKVEVYECPNDCDGLMVPDGVGYKCTKCGETA